MIIISLLDKLEQTINDGIISTPFTTASVKESTSSKYDKRLVKVKETNPQEYEFE